MMLKPSRVQKFGVKTLTLSFIGIGLAGCCPQDHHDAAPGATPPPLSLSHAYSPAYGKDDEGDMSSSPMYISSDPTCAAADEHFKFGGYTLDAKKAAKLSKIFDEFANRDVLLDEQPSYHGASFGSDVDIVLSDKDGTIPELRKALQKQGFCLDVWVDGIGSPFDGQIPNRVNIGITERRDRPDGMVGRINRDYKIG